MECGTDMMDLTARLCDMIALESGLEPEEIAQVSGLMSTGILDSFALVSVISFVEDQIGGEVPPADLTFANFDSVPAICAYVERVRVG